MSDVSAQMHPAASPHVPFFITAPGEGDTLLVAMAFFLVFLLLMVGVLYLRLHALPEHMAHRADKVQLQLVAVLGLISLFTHNHLFWIAGLLIALIDLPNVSSPLASISASLETLAGRARCRDDPTDPAPPPAAPMAAQGGPSEGRADV